MAKYDNLRSEQMAGGSLDLEDFVDLEAARHPGYFDSKARLEGALALDPETARLQTSVREQILWRSGSVEPERTP